ncbi:LysR family transcriptional regulator [Salinarimonas ramus]|uniref:LysR family transcriptional regulator n=1 Tax=Salinarimonas ramus TaxID=690164 RepID=A0A917V4E0_9HYPH|nr:LysR family transcriptional regulator [Salinarimonas ramus]GGK35269.1 LysR family transcriptional regulator [Salinarimonas ramus]
MTTSQLAWDDFRLVKTIAEARGLTGAAAALGVNHSTAFRRLGQLESALGVKLFDRHRTGYVLTTAGEEMCAIAERMDEDINGFARKIAGQDIAPAGELRVTTSDSLLVHLLIPIFADFRERYPEIRLDLVLSNQALNLSKRDADVAIRATDSPPETLVGRRLATINWAFYGRRSDFPDPHVPDLVTLYDRDWVSLGDNLSGLKVAKFVRDHVAPEKVAAKLSTVLGLAEAIEAGIGIGAIPCVIGDPHPGLRRLSDIRPEFSASLWLLTHPDLRRSARVRVFLDFVAGEIGSRRALIEG